MTEGLSGSKRWEIFHDEARDLVAAQNQTVTDIDEKAMRSVRLTAIVIGLGLTALQVDAGLFNRGLLTLSLLVLILSIIAGIVTYDESDLYLRPDGAYLEELAIGDESNTSWELDLFQTYCGMAVENADHVRINSRLLRVTNVLLIVGITAAITAVLFFRCGRRYKAYEQ